ncbi:uncharacterized protein MONBRDRAFT_22806 [Monosiga brevicollis MX1]|uniref:Bardet-Biedl syndrome 2 protein homolog n=1 Tax=Monosiga brevicollis TaxID=81824 RepID=A9US50_MONBE|nr:uncharacterized protein MONBRDRAFT_22806 [Monosiga brevicollis MX1]EDQ92040.1 predicted protein [Monosiga brevicollis MX1]|eukprot:XP_001743326.1 hypothetical protein [Monosiga brevicollis MX1]
MFKPAFQFKLGYGVLPGRVCAGRFDGQYPALACAGTGGKVIIHHPHQGDDAGLSRSAVNLLNFNRDVTALTAGSLDPAGQQDILYIGSASTLTAHDVTNNSDVFHIDAPDGVNSIVIGQAAASSQPLVFVGGGSAVFGYNEEGNDLFWMVAGDDICALILASVDTSAPAEDRQLVVGLAERSLSVYSEDGELVHEFAEQECKAAVNCLCAFDVTRDGAKELVVGQADGSLNLHQAEAGHVLLTDRFEDAVAGCVVIDYRREGHDSLLVVSGAGHDLEHQLHLLKSAKDKDSSTPAALEGLAEASLHLGHIIRSVVINAPGLVANDTETICIPANAATDNLQFDLHPAKYGPYTISVLALLGGSGNTNLWRVKNISTQLPSLFMLHPAPDVAPPREQAAFALDDPEVFLKWLSKQTNQAQLERLPAELVFRHVTLDTVLAFRYFRKTLIVCGDAEEQVAPIVRMMRKRLRLRPVPLPNLSDAPTALEERTRRRSKDAEPVVAMESSQPGSPGQAAQIPVRSDLNSPTSGGGGGDKAGEASRTEARRLPQPPGQLPRTHKAQRRPEGDDTSPLPAAPSASPPRSSEALASDEKQRHTPPLPMAKTDSQHDNGLAGIKNLLSEIADLHGVRQRLSAELAEGSNLVKSLLLRAEDYRLMGDTFNMRETYAQLHAANRDLVNAYTIRSTNHNKLLEGLKSLNMFIQTTAQLLDGPLQTEFVAECRECIRNSDMVKLFNVLHAARTTSHA